MTVFYAHPKSTIYNESGYDNVLSKVFNNFIKIIMSKNDK